MSHRFYITTPIYYVNDKPHLGHAYTTIAADVMARYMRMRGRKVFFLTGTDEHGQKVAQAAAQRGVREQVHCDAMHKNFKDLWLRLGIGEHQFIRTTREEHKKFVQKALRRLARKGYIYKKDYEGWYNISDEIFVTDPDEIAKLKEQGKVELVKEANYFFKMSEFQDKLIEAIENGYNDNLLKKAKKIKIHPKSRHNEVLGFLKSQELGDLSISRPKSRLAWGIEFPPLEMANNKIDSAATEHVCYVWVDALLNYVSALTFLEEQHKDSATWEKKFEPFWPVDFHLIGKDILTTHSVYWTTILMALDLPLPKNIFSHGWWTFEGQKMSKSIGNVVDPNKLIDEFGPDPIRYFVLREMPFGLDGDFGAEALVKRINGDLANDLGNLASRILNLLEKSKNRIPDSWSLMGDRLAAQAVQMYSNDSAEYTMIKQIDDITEIGIDNILNIHVKNYENEMEKLGFSRALEHVWLILLDTNKFIQDYEPWTKLGDIDSNLVSEHYFKSVILYGCKVLKLVTYLLEPFMPSKMQTLWEALGEDDDLKYVELKEGTFNNYRCRYWYPIDMQNFSNIDRGKNLFPRIDAKQIKTFADRAAELDSKGVPGTPEEGIISIDQFMGTELRVAQVVEAERVPKSKKLIRLQVEVGEEKGQRVCRQIVAGIGQAYAPEELVGKQVVIVFNLSPAKLMGVESQGMLLAAETEDGSLKVATFEAAVKNGVRVK